MRDCPFCDIAAGKLAASIFLETEHFFCFAPLVKEVPGHIVVASKAHYSSLLDAPPEMGSHLVATCQALAKGFLSTTGSDAFNLLNANDSAAQQSVMHLHVHFVPRRTDDGIDAWPSFGSQS